MDSTSSILTPTQRYAAGALFALALHQSQIHQYGPRLTHLDPDLEKIGKGASAGGSISVSENPGLWIHEKSGLLLPVFRFLGVENQTWDGLKETAGSSSQVRHHIGAFLTLLSEESDGVSLERTKKENALTKAVDATALSIESTQEYSEIEKNSDLGVSAEPPGPDQSSGPSLSVEKEKFNGNSGQAVEEGRLISYRRKLTILYAILSACVADSTDDDKKTCLPRKGYDARHRVVLRLLTTWLGIEWIEMEAMETMVAYSLGGSMKEGGKTEELKSSEIEKEKWKRGGIIGAATLTGGTLMAITGGLAAPAIAHGMAALAPTLGSIVPAIGAGGFAAAASATGSVAGSVAVAASFGAAGAGLTGIKMAKRTAGVEEFEFKTVGSNYNKGRLGIGIFISGLAFKDEDFVEPWVGHNDNMERYVLWWESKILSALTTSVEDWLTSRVAMKLMKEGAMYTVLSSLLTALSMPAVIISSFDIIDSKWAIALERSNKAGKLLAEVLLEGLHGNRPVTLIGFSLGARVIFKCLQSLADAEGDNAGLVERVVLLGVPVSIKDENWDDARKMVAGRFINVYSANDWTLGITCRASLFSQGLAGIQPVDLPGIENVDVSHTIECHSSYLQSTKTILEQLDLDGYYPVFKNRQSALREGKTN